MNRIYVSPEARQDLQNIKAYISSELENPSAAQKIVSRIVKTIKGLSDFPNKGVPLQSVIEIQTDYRFLVCGNYLVFYRREKDSVYILRVLYGKRDYIKILFQDLPDDEE